MAETNPTFPPLPQTTLLVPTLSSKPYPVKNCHSLCIPSDTMNRNVPIPNDADLPVEPNLDKYVWTAAFDDECREAFERTQRRIAEEELENLRSSDHLDILSNATPLERGPYDVPKLEASNYYAVIRPNGRGPKLIYRTSSDVFDIGGAYKRRVSVGPVPDNFDFGPKATWDMIRDKAVSLLDQNGVKMTSVDLVRFTWRKKYDDDSDAYYDDIPLVHLIDSGIHHCSNPTIWIGVIPSTLTGAVAHDCSEDIRAFLNSLEVRGIDIAYRESIYKSLASRGPALFPPVKEGDSLKDVIDNISVALNIPIAGCKTPMKGGSLGPYFTKHDKFYAITARHNVLPPEGGNDEYMYHNSAPKLEVMVMGLPMFDSYLASIMELINNLDTAVSSLERKILTLKRRVQERVNVDESQKELGERETELANTQIKITELRDFLSNLQNRWGKAEQRVIGFVRWAPPIGLGVPPHHYTRDLCVIELYKERFRSMMGNVLSLGPEMSELRLKSLIYERDDVPSIFKYPKHGLLPLRGMLSANQLNTLPSLDLQGDPIRYVLKRGSATHTTVGTFTRFMSFVRLYSGIDKQGSLEVAIFSHKQGSRPFSKGGDSGSLIVSTTGEFLALLTGGTNNGTDTSDVTYGTLFEWVWALVKAKFPGANLNFDNLLEEFLADEA